MKDSLIHDTRSSWFSTENMYDYMYIYVYIYIYIYSLISWDIAFNWFSISGGNVLHTMINDD